MIGMFLILANLLVVSTTLIFFFLHGFLFEELTTTIALIVPMFSVYTTAVIKSIIANRAKRNDETPLVSGQYIFISWLFPVIFTVYLLSLVVLKAFNLAFSSFEQFKTMLVGSETIFGAYAGLVISSMFDIGKTASTAEAPQNT